MRGSDPIGRCRLAPVVAGISLAIGGLLAPGRVVRAEVEAVTVRLEEAHCSS